ncbi:GPI inositol-deacylase [Spodoptera frugiperda]|uniref:GPI inositol-deacylase n=1 Tax=Spodoptera frugiperda TaxID=7108 RepID=A0A9R0F354_SPOFR|nr:GPI inositol-deacylase [Spodoptera frugiperda]
MRLLNILGSSVFQILSIVFVLSYLLGVLNLYFSDKNNYCIMTYMFEYPQFVRMTVPENKIYPQYALYAYSEGRFTERARKMWFDGVPVLFLPGNSGSHMQVRSLASVALRKALAKGYQHHFDFFTISYNEELSGLYGGVLEDQTKFAAACITKILSLYKSNRYTKAVPTSVILIGHSMGGIIAKRLLAYPNTFNATSLAITLAAPLEAPVVNVDSAMDNYYMFMDLEWKYNINEQIEAKEQKMLISFGNGPRDVLMPSGLTHSNDSYINALTTAIPGVWTSPDHVCIVWCKQLVMVINRYLFSIVDPHTQQLNEDHQVLKLQARRYFQANRSMILSPDIPRANMTMVADAFWYEDNRRIYQISRPQIDKMTYLMIRLVAFPQNRFVAVEAVNLEDSEWIFGCNAKFTYFSYRYCKNAISLGELSRWTGAAADFGKRKLATINLHKIKEEYPDWTHVIVKVSPTRKPIVLNVDINDHASRQIKVNVLSELFFGKYVIVEETEPDSLYYELVLKDFNLIHQAYLLHVEPTAGCKATQYHVSAELHVPWAPNHENYHYFTHMKQSPMKLRLYRSSPNATQGLQTIEHAKVTLLLDPQCTYTISLSTSWYLRLAQYARNYSPVLVPYAVAVLLLAVRSNILHLQKYGYCMSLHSALMSEGVKPYYALVFCRLGATVFLAIPFMSFLFESASWENPELRYFIKSLLVLPTYMTALGIVNIMVTVLLASLVFSSQIAHRLLFRIMWRGGSGLAEKVASGLQKVPMVVSAGLLCAVPLSCGAASLVAGAAFYAFMLSKMYEEYLEDYVYKLMAKVGSRICYMFKKKKPEPKLNVNESETSLVKQTKVHESETSLVKAELPTGDGQGDGNNETDVTSENTCPASVDDKQEKPSDVDEDLSSLNFHMMMFCLWLAVTLINVPALLTWARNFSHSMVLKPDTSYNVGLIMSACSTCVWQMNGPRKNLRHYESVTALLFSMAVFLIALGPLTLSLVNYGIALIFAVITVQQVWDKEDIVPNSDDKNVPKSDEKSENEEKEKDTEKANNQNESDEKTQEDKCEENVSDKTSESSEMEDAVENCDPCSESTIFNVFKRLRDKMTYTENL